MDKQTENEARSILFIQRLITCLLLDKYKWNLNSLGYLKLLKLL